MSKTLGELEEKAIKHHKKLLKAEVMHNKDKEKKHWFKLLKLNLKINRLKTSGIGSPLMLP